MKTYEELTLPQLPKPWQWHKGVDGGPEAVLIAPGWEVSVYQSDRLWFTTDFKLRILMRTTGVKLKPIPNIPVRVPNDVRRALCEWHEVEKEKAE